MNATPLKLSNKNNRLNCDGFLVIDQAPAHGVVKEDDFNKIYVLNHEGKDIYVKLYDFLRIKFSDISCVFTIPATGMDERRWKEEYAASHPRVDADTEMAVYCYLRQ